MYLFNGAQIRGVECVSCGTGGCGAKYTIHIDSEQFRGKRPIQQHKLVNEVSYWCKCHMCTMLYSYMYNIYIYNVMHLITSVYIAIRQALGDELKSIHAVSIRIGGPDD